MKKTKLQIVEAIRHNHDCSPLSWTIFNAGTARVWLKSVLLTQYLLNSQKRSLHCAFFNLCVCKSTLRRRGHWDNRSSWQCSQPTWTTQIRHARGTRIPAITKRAINVILAPPPSSPHPTSPFANFPLNCTFLANCECVCWVGKQAAS